MLQFLEIELSIDIKLLIYNTRKKYVAGYIGDGGILRRWKNILQNEIRKYLFSFYKTKKLQS